MTPSLTEQVEALVEALKDTADQLAALGKADIIGADRGARQALATAPALIERVRAILNIRKEMESMTNSNFEKIVQVLPAYNKLSEGYGIGSARIRFILKGPKGAIQFMIGTNWYVPSAREHLKRFSIARDLQMNPYGWDLGYHSPVPTYEGQEPMSGQCDVLCGQCYYDGSVLQADAMIEDFVAGGTEWLWPYLESRYEMQFGAQTND